MERKSGCIEDLLICQCSSYRHQILIRYDKDFKDVYVSFLLNKFRFWRRLWEGFKYILGYQSIYGHYDEVILRKCDADKLQRVVDKLKEDPDND